MRVQKQSIGQPPIVKSTTLIVIAAFERDEEGELRLAFEAQQMSSEHAAVQRAKLMSRAHASVIAWKRPAKLDEGEFESRKCFGSTETYRAWSAS